MNKYRRFEDFMVSVVKTADILSKELHNKSLNELYQVKAEKIQKAALALITKGWWLFIATTTLLLLGPAGFVTALAAFLSSPAGWAAAAILASVGGGAVIRTMYQNKKLPLAIRETGKRYKATFKSYQAFSGSELHDKVDNLEQEASNYLVAKALKALDDEH